MPAKPEITAVLGNYVVAADESNLLGGFFFYGEQLLNYLASKLDASYPAVNGSHVCKIYADDSTSLLRIESNQFDLRLTRGNTLLYFRDRHKANFWRVLPLCDSFHQPVDVDTLALLIERAATVGGLGLLCNTVSVLVYGVGGIRDLTATYSFDADPDGEIKARELFCREAEKLRPSLDAGKIVDAFYDGSFANSRGGVAVVYSSPNGYDPLDEVLNPPKPSKVLVQVRGGVAEVSADDGVEVLVLDYDNGSNLDDPNDGVPEEFRHLTS